MFPAFKLCASNVSHVIRHRNAAQLSEVCLKAERNESIQCQQYEGDTRNWHDAEERFDTDFYSRMFHRFAGSLYMNQKGRKSEHELLQAYLSLMHVMSSLPFDSIIALLHSTDHIRDAAQGHPDQGSINIHGSVLFMTDRTSLPGCPAPHLSDKQAMYSPFLVWLSFYTRESL